MPETVTTKTDHHLLDDKVSFQEASKKLGLDSRLSKAVAKLGYVYPTLVQAKCLPFALEGKDVLVHARTDQENRSVLFASATENTPGKGVKK